MNVTIRNIDAAVVAKLNELAKKRGMSREEYLRMYLENLAVLEDMKKLDLKYSELVNEIAVVINNNTKELQNIYNLLDEYKNNRKEL
jgi:metal-responsive CopG/Arc/MetJ family transcriptional regulator